MDQFKIIRKIGHGSFGDVYLARNIQTQEEIAIKKENKNRSKLSKLDKEYKICQSLPKMGFTNAYSVFADFKYNYMTMKLLGPSIEDIFRLSKTNMIPSIIFKFANQAIIRLKQFHQKGFIHQDVKPHNFLMSIDNQILYLIDYGLSKQYIFGGQHIKVTSNNKFVGTARYASLNTHMGITQSRRDDLESLGYIFIYFMNGKLPWQNINAINKKEKFKKIKSKKLMISCKELCHGLPNVFYIYITYCRDLTFYQTPDYDYLINLFKN